MLWQSKTQWKTNNRLNLNICHSVWYSVQFRCGQNGRRHKRNNESVSISFPRQWLFHYVNGINEFESYAKLAKSRLDFHVDLIRTRRSDKTMAFIARFNLNGSGKKDDFVYSPDLKFSRNSNSQRRKQTWSANCSMHFRLSNEIYRSGSKVWPESCTTIKKNFDKKR